jgi:4-amino-4-deoxy-L-arabinose transferase-like glycosyltransferase
VSKNTKDRLDPWLLSLLILAGILLFKNLGNVYLWEDEAITALLARSVLHFGYPTGFDGVNRILPVVGADSPYWINEPWLPFYIIAFFFRFFGESAFTARLPFVLFGLGSLWLTYVLARRLYPEKWIARIAVLLLVCSVPFLVLMRTCRYYSPTLFFSLAVMIAFVKFINNERFSSFLLGLSMVLCYFTNNGLWIPLVMTQIAYLLIFHSPRKMLWRYMGILIVNLILAIPWYWAAHTFNFGAGPTLRNCRRNLEFYVRGINKYILPLGFWMLFGAIRAVYGRFKEKGTITDFHRSSILLLLWVFVTLCFLVFVNQRYFRYLSSVFSGLFILHAVLIWYLIQSKLRPLGWVILPLLLLTNLLNSPQRVYSPIASYLYEITHDYDGPNEGIVRYLKKHAKKTDVVKLRYEDAPVMFYTGLKVDNRWYTEEETYPEWIIPRRPWAEEGFWRSEYYAKIQKRYERIEIPYPDIQWENREDLGEHHFRTVQDAPKVLLFRRKEDPGGLS